MNPTRRLYILIAGSFLTVAGCVGLFFILRRHRETIKGNLNDAKNKVNGMARSAWGRVANAADKTKDDLAHTERDPQTQS